MIHNMKYCTYLFRLTCRVVWASAIKHGWYRYSCYWLANIQNKSSPEATVPIWTKLSWNDVQKVLYKNFSFILIRYKHCPHMYIYKTTNAFDFCKPCEGYNLLVGSDNCTIWYQTIYTFQNICWNFEISFVCSMCNKGLKRRVSFKISWKNTASTKNPINVFV
jgi:hypothetical protein